MKKHNVVAIDSDALTLEEAAAYLHCHPVTIKRQADVLNIPYKKLGSLWRFSRKQLEAWLRDNDDEDKAA